MRICRIPFTLGVFEPKVQEGVKRGGAGGVLRQAQGPRPALLPTAEVLGEGEAVKTPRLALRFIGANLANELPKILKILGRKLAFNKSLIAGHANLDILRSGNLLQLRKVYGIHRVLDQRPILLLAK